ncbi:peptidylprolyl isomerase [Vibrio sp. UCD-FRSSP16_10]|uniref:peptidylprolyl isomerase n=1 Tax=unclassified Vibrio TaxID=2614977 RepID=UPI0007FE3B9B|nr:MULTISPECIES: peptidylprolyl isomerase [unclassified Vibrio]OBT10049.1 peptidylprolyl isomerase [Vibrio sp. UCD-FRSSP16_30]OBT18839.1 peptidylprolyl isomerase [Vibrio sp. UCD-FRSSP16_10]
MKIDNNSVVSLAYQVKLEEGVVVDQASIDAPLDYLHGHDNLVVGLEKALSGRSVGDKFSVTVGPEEAYGEHSDTMVQRVPANVFQGVEQIEVGMRFLAETDQGQIPVEITEVDGDEVVVDGNHMLAGQTLSFEVEVVAVRAATEDEIKQGHIHKEDAHSHDDDHECCGGKGDCGNGDDCCSSH